MTGLKPGQGDLWLRIGRWRQPIPLNRTDVGLTRASTLHKLWIARVEPGNDDFGGTAGEDP
jgi:hypothetical protein